jgi:hypothetical protein
MLGAVIRYFGVGLSLVRGRATSSYGEGLCRLRMVLHRLRHAHFRLRAGLLGWATFDYLRSWARLS